MTTAQNLLRLNFSAFDKNWFLNYAYTQLRDGYVITQWKKDIFYFIIDWLSGSDAIKSTTSGSTGVPKTITLKKEFVTNSAKVTNDFFHLKKSDSSLLCLPVKFIAGKLMIVRAMERGLDLYCVEPSLSPSFNQFAIDFAAMTPTQVASLLADGEGRKLLAQIDKLIVGGDAISPSLEDKIGELSTNVWHSYGMTETITHIAMRKVNGVGASQNFTPLKHAEVSLASDNCLVIDASLIGVAKLKTNDIAELHADGSFRVRGRKDNVVISGGIKLFPEEIEKKITGVCNWPYYLAGVNDDLLGNRLVMYVESSVEIDTGNLLKKIASKVDKYQIPKEIIVVKQFVRTDSGKILRHS